MALDRQSIERRDFPIERRGYDTGAVDAHLAQIADELEALTLCADSGTERLSASTGEQVHAILHAAECSASEIRHAAELAAREVRAEAEVDADAARIEALAQARSYVGRVAETTAMLLQRLEAMDTELATLVGALRGGDAPPAGEKDAEDARLVALSMALNGTARDEADRYLAENFKLTDRRGVVDEAYSSVEE